MEEGLMFSTQIVNDENMNFVSYVREKVQGTKVYCADLIDFRAAFMFLRLEPLMKIYRKLTRKK